MGLENLHKVDYLGYIAAKYLILYEELDDDEGYSSLRYSRRRALDQIARESGVDLNNEEILKEWEDEDYQTERKRHKCPVCQKLMVKRKNKKTGKEFWGCESFAESKHKLYYQNRKEKKYNQWVDDDDNYWSAMESYFSMDYDNGW